MKTFMNIVKFLPSIALPTSLSDDTQSKWLVLVCWQVKLWEHGLEEHMSISNAVEIKNLYNLKILITANKHY